MRLRYIIAVTLSALLVLVGCSERSTLEDGRLVVGFDADFPPYGFKVGDEYRGFDLDLARAVCARKGWMFVASPINWDAKDMELDSGAIDCIWNGFTMQGRERNYTWSSAYISNAQVVMVKTSAMIHKLADLDGKVVGVQTDTPVEKKLSKGNSFGRFVIEPNYNQLVNELDMGGVDAVAMDAGVARKKMQDQPGKFRVLNEWVMTETYGIGFKLGNTKLRDQVEAELAALVKDGTMHKLARQYGIDEESVIFKPTHSGDVAKEEKKLSLCEIIRDLLGGLAVSVEIFVLTLVMALPLGFLIAFGRMSNRKFIAAIFRGYISIVRGTPLMLQIMFVYFAPYMLFGLPLSGYPRLLATVIAFSLNYAAYFAEIYRGGIMSIDKGQSEAARALGMPRAMIFMRIILPQVIKRVIPAVGNEVITLVKDTSLAFTIAVTEMFTIAKQLSSANTTMVPLIAAGIFYYLFNFIVALAIERCERRLAYYD